MTQQSNSIRVEELNLADRSNFNTREHLRNAERQARERNFSDILIVDVDAHIYEAENYRGIFEYIEDPALRELALSVSSTHASGGSHLLFGGGRNQFNAGRQLRYGQDEVPEDGEHLDVTRSRRQREAIGLDYQLVFPTTLLDLGLHPDPRVETQLSLAFTRWWVDEVMSKDPRLKTLVMLPFHDADASLRVIREFSEKPGVLGFLVTSARYTVAHDDRLMPVYKELEERNMPIGFHAVFNQRERMFEGMNKFLSVHALGFVFTNAVHATNLVINGIPERFPNLRIIMIESGLAWVPWLMQRLDNEYLMRTNEAPLLKRRPSEYLADFYYTTQPIEMENLKALELTMEMINANTQLMFASDYPHWDFNLPSTIWDLPFLPEESKVRILGKNALRCFPKLADEIKAEPSGPKHLL